MIAYKLSNILAIANLPVQMRDAVIDSENKVSLEVAVKLVDIVKNRNEWANVSTYTDGDVPAVIIGKFVFVDFA